MPSVSSLPKISSVVVPNNQSVWFLNSEYNVEWNGFFYKEDFVQINLLMDEKWYSSLVSSTQNDGSCAVFVPVNTQTGDNFRVQILPLDGGTDFSTSGVFSIHRIQSKAETVPLAIVSCVLYGCFAFIASYVVYLVYCSCKARLNVKKPKDIGPKVNVKLNCITTQSSTDAPFKTFNAHPINLHQSISLQENCTSSNEDL